MTAGCEQADVSICCLHSYEIGFRTTELNIGE